MKNRTQINHTVRRFFEGEPEPVVAPVAAPVTAPAPVATPPKSYSEADFNNLVNRKLAEEKRKNDDKSKQLVAELTALRESANLTEEQKTALDERVQQLEASYRTAEESKKIEIAKEQERYNRDIAKKNEEIDSWHNRHDQLLISVEINRAAIKHNAFDADQLLAILLPLTKVSEQMDSSGKPLGTLAPRVKFTGPDREGNSVTLDLSVDDAVKAMRETPNKYGNLFKDTMASGIGANPNGGSAGNGRIPDIDGMSPQQYAANRNKIIEQMRKSR